MRAEEGTAAANVPSTKPERQLTAPARRPAPEPHPAAGAAAGAAAPAPARRQLQHTLQGEGRNAADGQRKLGTPPLRGRRLLPPPLVAEALGRPCSGLARLPAPPAPCQGPFGTLQRLQQAGVVGRDQPVRRRHHSLPADQQSARAAGRGAAAGQQRRRPRGRSRQRALKPKPCRAGAVEGHSLQRC